MTVAISPIARDCQVTEANIKELQAARLVLLDEARELEQQAKRKRGYATGITAALCMIQLSLGNKDGRTNSHHV